MDGFSIFYSPKGEVVLDHMASVTVNSRINSVLLLAQHRTIMLGYPYSDCIKGTFARRYKTNVEKRVNWPGFRLIQRKTASSNASSRLLSRPVNAYRPICQKGHFSKLYAEFQETYESWKKCNKQQCSAPLSLYSACWVYFAFAYGQVFAILLWVFKVKIAKQISTMHVVSVQPHAPNWSTRRLCTIRKCTRTFDKKQQS